MESCQAEGPAVTTRLGANRPTRPPTSKWPCTPADPWALQPGTGTRKGKSQTFLYLLTARLNRSHHPPPPTSGQGPVRSALLGRGLTGLCRGQSSSEPTFAPSAAPGHCRLFGRAQLQNVLEAPVRAPGRSGTWTTRTKPQGRPGPLSAGTQDAAKAPNHPPPHRAAHQQPGRLRPLQVWGEQASCGRPMDQARMRAFSFRLRPAAS